MSTIFFKVQIQFNQIQLSMKTLKDSVHVDGIADQYT